MRRFLHASNRAVAALLLAAAVVLAGTGYWIWIDRRAELTRETQNIGSISRVLADHVGRSVQAVDQILFHVAEDLSETPVGAAWRDVALHQRLVRLNRSAPQIRNMAVFDAKGDLVSSSSAYPPRRINVSDRAYFHEMSADPTQRLRFEGPFRNRVNGKWTVGFFRPVPGRDGRLRGLVYVALETNYFRGVFGTVRQWSDSDFALLDKAGRVLLRYPLEPDATAPLAGSAKARAVGNNMIVSTQPVAGYPLVMVVSRSVRGALGHWRHQALTLGAAASLLCLLLMLSALYMNRQLSAGAAREKALRDSERRYREMVDGSGLAIQISDDNGKRLYGNRTFARMAGFESFAEMMAAPPMTFVAPSDRERVHRFHLALVGGEPGPIAYDFTALRRDGTTFPVQAVLQRAEFDGRPAVQRTFIDLTALKRAEQALQRERDLANKVVETAPVIILILDRAGHIEHANPYLEQLTGRRIDDIKGKSWLDEFVPERDRERFRSLFDGSMAGRAVSGGINPIVTASGAEREILWFDRSMTDDAGNITGVLAIGQDVTDLKRAERELAEREHSLANAQRIGHMGDWERNLVTGDVRWSDQIFRLLGRDRQSFAASFENVLLVAHPADREKIRRALADALEAHASTFGYDARIILPDGEIRMIEQHAEITYADDGTPLRANGIMHDVSDRVLTEEALRRSEIRLRNIMDNMLDSIVVIDERGVIDSVNRATYGVFGYETRGLVGKNVKVLMPERFGTEHNGYLRSYLATGKSNILGRGPREVTGLTEEGREIPLELGISEMRLGDRRYFIGTLRDISDRKIVEAQLRQAQKMEAVGQLTGGVAHDFNNLLAVISGNLEMLHEKLEDRPALRRMADTALRSVRRGADLTRSLLSYARRQPMTEAPVDLNLLISETVELMRRMLTEAVDIRMEPAPGLWPCRTDSTLLQTALINLALNARDAMPEGGKLVIGLANRSVSAAEAAAQPDFAPGDYIAISVRDSGVGMTKEVVERVFEPFFTTKEVGRGTGLGLSMVYGFVKQSGGHVQVTSVPRSGTTVTLLLPRDAEGAEPHADGQPVHGRGAPAGARRQARILVVEDDPDIRTLAVTLLASQGYEVADVEGAAPALALLRDDRRFDLLLTDAMLRGKAAGEALAGEACTLVPGLRVLFMSGHAETLVRHDGRTPPEVMVLRKPFQIEELMDAVRRALECGPEETGSWVAAS